MGLVCIPRNRSLGQPYPITRLHLAPNTSVALRKSKGAHLRPCLHVSSWLPPIESREPWKGALVVTCRKNVPGNPITCQIPFLANHLSNRKTIQPINSFDLQDNIFVAHRKSLDFFNAQVNFCLIPTPSTNQNCSFFWVSILLHIATMAVSPPSYWWFITINQ
jgi:hypothetical protein